MDEPIHARESRFWDDVADWILDSREYEADLSDAQIEAMLRPFEDDDFESH